MKLKRIKSEQVKKIVAMSMVTSMLIQATPMNIFANEKTKEENNIEMSKQEGNKANNEDSINKEDGTKLEKDVKNAQDIPNFDITTNITDKPFGINSNFTMTFNMNSDATTNKTIKKGDKIKVQLPPGAINSFVLDVSDVPTLKLNLNKDTGELIIEFTEDIVSTGNSLFRINLVVGDKKISNYKINTSFEREGNVTPLQISNNDIFNSSGEYVSNYKFLSPYWNTGASNYIGQDEQNHDIGLFLNTTNKASFYVDVNSGFNYTDTSKGFEVSIETIDNIELIKDSVKVVCYDGENDKTGTPVPKENLKWWPQLQEGVHRLGIKENYTGKRYRIFFDGSVKNIQAPFKVQFYSNKDTYYPFLNSKMTDKISNSNYIPNIFGATHETIKVGSNFEPKKGMSAYDEEDKFITNKLNVIKDTVNTNVPGNYEVVYEVTDTAGNTTRLIKTVTVVTDNPPILNGVKDKTIKIGESFDPRAGVTATDTEDGPISPDKIKIFGNVDTNKVGVYQLIYEVTDNDGNTTQKSALITVKSNDKPVIKGVDNVSIKQGTAFDPKAGVTATDTEDGSISSDKIKVTGTVNINTPGKYELTYSVTDSDGNTTTVKRVVTVNPKMVGLNATPIIKGADDKTIKVGDNFDPKAGVTAEDKEDGNITDKIKVVENTVNTSKAGTYTVKYEVTDSKGATTTKTIKITVEKLKVILHNKYINGYPDKTFRQENSITRGELSAMLARIILDGKPVPVTENKFSDISNDYWGKNEVNYLASKGILIGYEDGTFRPENPITRAEIATMLVRANTDIKKKIKAVFPDVNNEYWAKKYIDKANELGYMIGYEDGTFRPENPTTRAETVVTLNRIYRNPCDFKETNSSKIPFTDLDKNNWAYNDIIKATISHEHIEKK